MSLDYASRDYNRVQYAGAANLNKRIGIYRFNSNPENWYDWVFARLPLGERSRVLECGCGNGNLWVRNLAAIPAGTELTLADQSEAMLADCRANLGEAASRFRFLRFDIANPPDDLGAFSLIVANHVLYHIADLDRALAGLGRLLSPDGAFAASTIGLGDNQELGELLHGYSPAIEFDHAKVAARFGLENGRAILESHFRDVELLEYPNRLEITDAGAIFDYAMSLYGIDAAVPDKDDFRAYLDRALAAAGGTYIVTKRTGLFLAAK